jgi:hypothetical protein
MPRSSWQRFSAAVLRRARPRTLAEARAAMRRAGQLWRRETNPRSNPGAEAMLEEIRRHFAAHPRGMVQVTTMTRATRYRSADWFRVNSKGNLQVRRGRTWDTISLGDHPMVGIRLFNPARRKKKRPTGGDWQPDLFGGRGIERREGLTRAEQLELAREEMRQTGQRDLFDAIAERNPRRSADTPEMRYQRAVGHGERLATARKAAANPGRAVGRMSPNCPMCGALVRLPNPVPPRVTCHQCGAESQVRRP